jgi:hypothetical protein
MTTHRAFPRRSSPSFFLVCASLLASLSFGATPARADEGPPPGVSSGVSPEVNASTKPSSPRLSSRLSPSLFVETDPSTFVLHGYAAHVRTPLPTLPALVIGGGIYGLTLPTPLAELAPASRHQGWHVAIRNAYALFLDYHLQGTPNGLFIGLQLGLQNTEATRDQAGDARAHYWTFVGMPRLGYLWHPFSDSGFYVLPWAGVGTLLPFAGSRTVGDATYHVFPVMGFATLHIGWAV